MSCLKNKFVLELTGIFIFAIVAFMSFAFMPVLSAAVSVGEPNYSIEKVYGPEFGISGWINLSFENEPTNSFFTTFFDGVLESSVNLQNILDLNPNYTYTCIPSDCGKDYSASLPAASKTFDISSNESKIFGLLLTGKVIAINSINFEIESTAGPSCESQLKVDVLDDGVIDMLNYNVGTVVCPSLKSYGCFEATAETEEYILSPGRTYCQKINLSESPGFKLGAWIKYISGSSTINVTLYNSNGAKKAEELTFGSTVHGAGRVMSRSSALRKIRGEDTKKQLNKKGIEIKAGSWKSLGEESPEVYKDIEEVVKIVDELGISKKIARLRPLAVVKG